MKKLIFILLIMVVSCNKDTTVIEADVINEDLILQLVNYAREVNELELLVWDEDLEEKAATAVIIMNNTNEFKHHNSFENIAWGQDSEPDVFYDWMNSDGHRANILNPNARLIGVARKGIYWSMVLSY